MSFKLNPLTGQFDLVNSQGGSTPSASVIDDWTPNTAYIVDQVVIYKLLLFRATQDHTSDASDFANDLDKWECVSEGASIINEASHGFSEKDAVYFDGSNWQKAQANNPNTLGKGVAVIVSIDYFVLVTNGYVEIPSHGLTVDEYYFVSNVTAGLLTSTEPATGYTNPLLWVKSTDVVYVEYWRPQDLTSISGVSSLFLNTVTKTTNYTATDSDDVILVNATSGSITINLPAAAGVTNKVFWIKKIDSSANKVTINANGSETIDNELTIDLLSVANAGESIGIVCDGFNWWII